MKRGEIWTIAGGPAYAGKPRPSVILQSDAFSETASVTICGFTSDPTNAPSFRIHIAPDASNGLERASHLMADKITTVRKEKLGRRIGRLSEADLTRLNEAVIVFLGLVEGHRRAENK